MNRRLTGRLAALPVTAVLLVLGAAPALAHEPRTSAGLQFTVGWGEEPAYTGFKNSVQVIVSEANGTPLTDLGDSLKVEVTKGAEKITLPLVANFRVGGIGTPGDYRAWVTPTRPGTYTFRVMGTVRGQPVDESFTSSRNTFDEVEDVSNIQFPAKDPSPGQLATRIDREFPRLDSRTDALEARLDEADSARTLSVVAVVVGGLGLLVAVSALVAVRVRRRDGPKGSPEAQSEKARSVHR